MARYRYVGGSTAGIYETPWQFTSYGQLVDLPPEIEKICLDGRHSLVTEEEFDSQHTDESWKKYTQFEMHARAPQSFLDARAALWKLAQAKHPPMRSASTGMVAPE